MTQEMPCWCSDRARARPDRPAPMIATVFDSLIVLVVVKCSGGDLPVNVRAAGRTERSQESVEAENNIGVTGG